jgi:hypothetical protein
MVIGCPSSHSVLGDYPSAFSSSADQPSGVSSNILEEK